MADDPKHETEGSDQPEFLDDASAMTRSEQAPTETVLEKESAKYHGDPLDHE